jgi:hypothetical protein
MERLGRRCDDGGSRVSGDKLVPEPQWSWMHGTEIDSPADAV